MASILQDIRFALRSFRRRPGLAVVVILTLGLGIGANTAIFSVINGLLLRPQSGVRPTGELVEISRDLNGSFFDLSYPVFHTLRVDSPALDDYCAFTFVPVALGGDAGTTVVGGLNVTGNYFSLLGTRPAHGRFFLPEESFFPNAGHVAVISHDLWQRHYLGEKIVGRRILVNGFPVEIIGVAEAGFGGHAVGLRIDVWVPIGAPVPGMRSEQELRNWDSGVLETLGRLREGTTATQAKLALEDLANRRNLNQNPDAEEYRLRVVPYGPVPGVARGGVTAFFTILMSIMGLVLGIACINVAGVLLSRSTERSGEIAIRLSLGAGRARLIQQLLTESLLLSLAAAGLGALIARWVTGLMMVLQPPIPIPGVRIRLDVAPDLRVLGFSILLAVLTGLIFGLVPALRATRPELVPALRHQTSSAAPGKQRFRSILTAGQVAATLLLLVGAGLFLRAMNSRNLVDPGFRAEDVQAIGFDLQLSGYDDDRGREFYGELLEGVRGLPGVESATLATKLPLAGRSSFGPVQEAGNDAAQPLEVAHNVISADYFRTLQIPILEGRDFREREGTTVAVINQALARRLWPGGRVVGRQIVYGGAEFEVIGVAATAKYNQLAEGPTSFLYLHRRQVYSSSMTLQVRTPPGSTPPVAAIRDLVAGLNPGVPVLTAMPLSRALEVHFLPQRLAAWVTAVVGLVGLGLGSVGIYGATAFAAGQRTREVGVRLALGATPREIASMMIGRGMRAPLLGMALGLLAALALTRFLETLLVGVSPLDPITFGVVLVTLLAVTVLANLLPAHRVSRLDPMRTLRSE